MLKKAHITANPNYEVGDKVLGLCGKEWKVEVKWEDVPAKHPICRNCVDIALRAMTEADVLIETARTRVRRLSITTEVLAEVLEPDLLLLDSIAETDQAYRAEREQKTREKAERKRTKQTCTCTWESMEDFVVDPDCPIHGTLEEGTTTEEEVEHE